MRVLIFGATGMVGQGVLRECLLDSEIDVVATWGELPPASARSCARSFGRICSVHDSNRNLRLRRLFFVWCVIGGMPEAQYENSPTR
jgi:hypothetical protein